MCFQANVYSKKAMDTSIWLVLVKKNTFMSPSATVWFIDVSNRLHNGVCGIVDYTKNKDYQLVFWVSPDKVHQYRYVQFIHCDTNNVMPGLIHMPYRCDNNSCSV